MGVRVSYIIPPYIDLLPYISRWAFEYVDAMALVHKMSIKIGYHSDNLHISFGLHTSLAPIDRCSTQKRSRGAVVFIVIVSAFARRNTAFTHLKLSLGIRLTDRTTHARNGCRMLIRTTQLWKEV
jgi:hypothetical protein